MPREGARRIASGLRSALAARFQGHGAKPVHDAGLFAEFDLDPATGVRPLMPHFPLALPFLVLRRRARVRFGGAGCTRFALAPVTTLRLARPAPQGVDRALLITRVFSVRGPESKWAFGLAESPPVLGTVLSVPQLMSMRLWTDSCRRGRTARRSAAEAELTAAPVSRRRQAPRPRRRARALSRTACRCDRRSATGRPRGGGGPRRTRRSRGSPSGWATRRAGR